MKIYRYILAMIIVLLLSGCETLEQYKAEHDLKVLNEVRASCLTYGFKESTDAFATCVQTEINEIKNRDTIEATDRRVGSRFSMTCRD
ncbi:hypothetical protein ACLKMH_18185 [Psychromonas sp. KJ10-10]|uniref:hypothetical protein n=1 Tax=Psychromonas sp. KJ10-10 TaxID=3391823 RepID=UPI0039B6DA68